LRSRGTWVEVRILNEGWEGGSMFFSLELSQVKFNGIISDLRPPSPSLSDSPPAIVIFSCMHR
jgi:hypothetical protein